MRRLLLSLAAAIIAAQTALAFSPSDSLRTAQWREDLRLLKQSLEERHPNAWFRYDRDSWEEDYRALHYQIPLLTEDQAYVRTMQLVASLEDGHTRTWTTDATRGYDRLFPFRTYWFADGLYVVSATSEYADLVGTKIVRYGNLDAEAANDLAARVYSYGNEIRHLHNGPLVLMRPWIVHALGVTNARNEVELVVEDASGRRSTVTVVDQGDVRFTQQSWQWMSQGLGLPTDDAVFANAGGELPLGLRHRDRAFWFEYLPDKRSIYFQFNVVRPTNEGEDETFADFIARMFVFIEENEVDKLIIDLRYNGGGNNQLVQPLIHAIIRSDKINERGRLFTMTGRQTFSAAMSCAGRLERHTNTLFVGEPPGSLPNQYGDARTVTLPNSGLLVRISTVWWMNTDGLDRREYVAPHIPVQPSFADYASNRDPALDKVLSLERYQTLDEVFVEALEAGGLEAARAAYRAFKRDNPDVWGDTKRVTNTLGYQLMNGGNTEAAIAAFELNVETYPDYANGWDSLGEGWMKAGDYDKAIAFYQKSIELDPSNTNAVTMIERMRAGSD